MLWWEENDFDVNPQAIVIVSALVDLLIPHSGGIPVDQPFLRQIVVYHIGIPFVLTVLVFNYLTPRGFLLILLYL